ncbi:MAG: hypothetical protein J6C05_10140 [Prevotella sp.]|nr:hypothetical protein [Prevotella sp.]
MKKFIVICYVLSILGYIPMMASKIALCLKCEEIDKKPILPDRGKAPVRIPVIYQDGHTISFQPHHPEYIINIVHDGEVVFSSVVPTDATHYDLPDYISGECVIQFLTENYCFWAEIEL